MEWLYLLAAAVSAAAVAALLWRLLVGPHVVTVTLVTLAIVFLAGLIAFLVEEQSNLDKTREKASKSCAPYKARIFEVTAKTTIVYECLDDHRLRVLKY
jgi:hypothetical protein